MKLAINKYFETLAEVANKISVQDLTAVLDSIESAANLGNKVITCGNGGSALTASHFITDWNKMVNVRTGKKFRGMCLADNVGLMTAFGNDLSYADIFSGQLNAIMDENDLLIVVSGSGNSKNVIKCVEAARLLKGQVIGILGFDGGKLKSLCDLSVVVPSFDMQICEDLHLSIGHLVMKRLVNDF